MISYNLHEGGNLVSFPYIPENDSVSFLFDDIKYELDGIIGEGVAAMNLNGNWIGGLSDLSPGSGYWFKSNADMCFNYTCAE